MREEAILALVVSGILVLGGVALVVHAYRNAFEALGARARVARLAQVFGGVLVGTQQWIVPRGAGHAALLVVSGGTGLNRISLWASNLPAAAPRTFAGVVLTYDEPLRRAFRALELDRVSIRRRAGISAWLGPREREQRVLGDLAGDLRCSSSAPDDEVRALLAPPEIRARILDALALGFDELLLYPPNGGVELVAHTRRAEVIDPQLVRAALARIEPLAGALSR